MTPPLEARLDILPAPQREVWPALRPVRALRFVLYGGTAVALHLGHRISLDFDFFRSEPLDKRQLYQALDLLNAAAIVQDEVDTLVVRVPVPSGSVKISFFGNIRFGRARAPLPTSDDNLLVASLEDLMATKLKAILDRAEVRDYQDIAAMLRNGISLDRGLAAFKVMFGGEPATVLRAVGWFEDGNLSELSVADRATLLSARDSVGDLPQVVIMAGLA
jgi:Nucleotidyl transferase AbiEii toxin, Type IV TA system